MFNKLFTPKAPKQVTPEAGSVYRVSFPGDSAKQPIGQPELRGAVSRVVAEIARLREVIATGATYRPAADISAAIDSAYAAIQAATVVQQSHQAQARAGLIKESAVVPYLRASDEARALFSNLHDELHVRQEADAAAVALAALLAEVQ